MTWHTPEPWKRSGRARWVVLSDVHPRKAICVMRNQNRDDPEPQEADANAERIVACVNGCKGINPESVPGLLRACRAVSVAVHCNASRGGDLGEQIDKENPLTIETMEAAIAKACP